MKNISINTGLIKWLSITMFVISVISTGCCTECLPKLFNHNELGPKKPAEALAVKENAAKQKTGMIMSFNDETPVVYKDLSLHHNFKEEKKCPYGLESVHSNVSVGPNINFKSAGSDVYSEGSHKPGIGFQVLYQTAYQFSDKLSVVPGIGFKQNNAKEVGEFSEGGEPPYNTSYRIEDKYTYNYITAPILAQFNLSESFSFSAGPEFNYLLNAKVKTNTTMAGQDHSEKIDISDESVKFGLGVQAGVKYNIPDSKWGIELMYDHRLSRLNKSPDGYESPAWRMKSVQLSAKCRICDFTKPGNHPKRK